MTNPLVRLEAKTRKVGECSEWTGSLTRGGYGQIRISGRLQYVHRVSYEAANGEVPPGLFLDHLCRNRRCVNPAHLEPVTCLENTRRGLSGAAQRSRTHCPMSHPYDAINTYRTKEGKRMCRKCAADRMRARRARSNTPTGDTK